EAAMSFLRTQPESRGASGSCRWRHQRVPRGQTLPLGYWALWDAPAWDVAGAPLCRPWGAHARTGRDCRAYAGPPPCAGRRGRDGTRVARTRDASALCAVHVTLFSVVPRADEAGISFYPPPG